jgi:hypothetical protein
MAALAAETVGSTSPARGNQAGFTGISTSCERCGAPSGIYFFNPFRAFCVKHARSLPPPVAVPERVDTV